MSKYSIEHTIFLKKQKLFQQKVFFTKILIVFLFLLIWELLVDFKVINSFLYSSPKLIINSILSLIKNNLLLVNLQTTIIEVIISFIITSTLGIIIASLMWYNKFFSKVIEPFLIILNSLPKVALGPLFIIWTGANTKSIIIMSITISLFTTIINLYQAFILTNKNYIYLLKTMNAKKIIILFKVVIPSNFKNIINTLKINMSLTFIGVIMGELLVSKNGLGYLITYGSQVFNINLVICSIFVLGVFAALFNYFISYIENKK